jgi:hypothetical protein
MMEFKIDARDTYTVITPICATLSTAETALLSARYEELTRNGSFNCILDLQNCQEATDDALQALGEMAMGAYEEQRSFVLTNLPAPMLSQIKAADLIDQLPYAPSFAEAVDVISMEILERDLFNEE